MSETTPEAGRYAAVPPQVDLPAMEHEIIDLWHRQHTFEKTLEATRDGEPWTFFEGPPTANGQPGTHHVEARVFKDVFPRYRTMRGYHVDRKAGWDCHGLPVELAVEKELGFSGKPDIEQYGVEPFNAKCRESVTRHVDAFRKLYHHLVEGEEATLKRLRRKGASIALEPANSAYETRIFGPDQVEVQGKLVGLMRRYH